MLGVSHAASVGFNFQVNYCGAASYTGAPVTAQAFGIDPAGWESLTPMDTGYGCDAAFFTLNEVIDTTTSADGLHPLPAGSLSVTWSAYTANASGFGGYDRSPPHYTFGGNGHRPGEEEVYWGFLRDGVNFGPGSSGGDNDQPGYNIDLVGLKSLFGTHPFVVQLVGSGDSIQNLTNAFIIDATLTATQSVAYPNIPVPGVNGDTAWPRGVGGGLSTSSGPVSTDHLQIVGNRAQHVGPNGDTPGFNNASTIAGFIITDQPVVTMSPQPVLAGPGDNVTLRAIAIGVPPLTIQWRKDGVAIPGATSLTYGIPTVSAADGGHYDVLVTNVYGSATSKVAALTVDRLAIARQPFVLDSKPGGTAHDGLDLGAAWVASNRDGDAVTRTGVMQFAAAHPDQIVLPASSADFDVPAGTISFWMRSAGTVTDAGADGAVLFDRGLLVVQNDDGTILVQTNPSSVNQFSSAAKVNDDKWHHVAVVFDQTADTGTILIYIDGALSNSQVNTGGWTWPAQQIELGRSHDSHWRAYNGLLDDVRLYNTQLNDAQVASIHNNDALVDAGALVVRLNFDTAPAPGVSINWQLSGAVLESSDTLTGTYTTVDAAAAPYAVRAEAGAKFYRYTHRPGVLLSNPYDM